MTLVSIASSMTLLPAMLAKLGDRINWPRLSKRARLDTPHDVQGASSWEKSPSMHPSRRIASLQTSMVKSMYAQTRSSGSAKWRNGPGPLQA